MPAREILDLDALAEKVAERLRPPDDRPLLTVRRAAERLGLSERVTRELIGRGVRGEPGGIPSILVADGARRVEPAAVDAYLAGRRDAS